MRGMSDDLEEIMIRERMKKRRLSENQNEEIYENEDRLSDLPDCVILHILSFLNTKHVVRTCVLSTRWKHLWKRIPTLILHSSRFSTLKKFTVFVHKILTLRDTSSALHALDLDRRGNIEPQLLKKILNYVCSHNNHLSKLGISVRGDSSFILSCVSSCRALTSLQLSIYPRGNDFTETLFPKSLNLPLLTSLDLTNFAFDGGETGCAEPFLVFTKLNSLVICSCKVKDASTLRISSETLVNLAIDSPLKKISFVVQHNLFNIVMIELSTPNLCTFKFTGDLVQKICGSGLSSVKQVNIYSRDFSALAEHALVLRSWLLDFANVESLTVTSTVLQILSLVPDLLEVKLSLCYLKSMEIELIPIYDISLLLLIKEAMLKKAAAKSRKEVAMLRKAFKARLEPPAIPDGIVDFLRQNSPSAEVKITTDYSSNFNLKQIEESIKGAKIIKYRPRFAAPASPAASASSSEFASNASPASATEPASAAPPNLHLCRTEKDDKSSNEDKVEKHQLSTSRHWVVKEFSY
ncbi:F-box/LRR-repeat protein At4g14103-like [Vicia villosa]|uniref:F-box/LRR-repeat protein At4g14103-like n=1 Tax=Vicia villosa TaxID=3911 RepID=UPI00273BADE3|nr:F-box/LRR-repeat protein At4g14103-like [Vicia villosa]